MQILHVRVFCDGNAVMHADRLWSYTKQNALDTSFQVVSAALSLYRAEHRERLSNPCSARLLEPIETVDELWSNQNARKGREKLLESCLKFPSLFLNQCDEKTKFFKRFQLQ